MNNSTTLKKIIIGAVGRFGGATTSVSTPLF